jgi:hypothetical protein
MLETRTATQIPQANQEQGESTMSELDIGAEQVAQLFRRIGGNNLEESRYAYRKILYAGAMKILRDFPEIIIGPPPDPSPQPQPQPQQQQQQQQQQQEHPAFGGGAGGNPGRGPGTAGEKPPYRPSVVCQLVCIASGE